jgi:hypothetical protein
VGRERAGDDDVAGAALDHVRQHVVHVFITTLMLRCSIRSMASVLARPMPDAAPVTTATLPINSLFAMVFLLVRPLEGSRPQMPRPARLHR